MERIGNAGWFMSNEEYENLNLALDLLGRLLGKRVIDDTLTCDSGVPYNEVNFPYDKNIKINESYPQCPNCPWKNPGDWTWRPWQAPWYGPGEPVPTDWKIGDGEWWKHQPYCTSTTGYNPDVVKETLTAQNNAEDKTPLNDLKRHA